MSSPPAAAPDRREANTYRHGQLRRRGTMITVVVCVVVFVALLARSLIETAGWNWTAPILGGIAANGYNLIRAYDEAFLTLHLTADELHVERPIQDSLRTRYADVRRVMIGGKDVEVYVTPRDRGTSGADVRIPRTLSGDEDVIATIVRRLPPGTVIDHPSGEFAALIERERGAEAS